MKSRAEAEILGGSPGDFYEGPADVSRPPSTPPPAIGGVDSLPRVPAPPSAPEPAGAPSSPPETPPSNVTVVDFGAEEAHAGGPIPSGGAHDPNCPHCQSSGRTCPNGHTYYPVSEETAKLVAMTVSGFIGSIAARGTNAEPAPFPAALMVSYEKAWHEMLRRRASKLGQWDDIIAVLGMTAVAFAYQKQAIEAQIAAPPVAQAA